MVKKMIKKNSGPQPNRTAPKVWIAISSLVLGILLLAPTLLSLPILSPLGSVIYTLVNLPGEVLYSILSPTLQDSIIANDLVQLFSAYLNFFIVGLVVSLLLYRKYGKIIYWSILFTLPTFLLGGLVSLIADQTAIDTIIPFPFFRIIFAVSAPVGYYLGLYVGSKIKRK